jgi:hypothetical protein
LFVFCFDRMGRIRWAGHGKITWRPRGSKGDIKMSVGDKRCVDKEWIKVALNRVMLCFFIMTESNRWILQVE